MKLKTFASNIITGFSEKKDGDLSFYNQTQQQFKQNWQQLNDNYNLNLPFPSYLIQEHKDKIIELKEAKAYGELGIADAIITKLTDKPIGVFTADCLPILMFTNKYIAAVHAGWRGSLLNIAAKTAKLIALKSNTDISKVTALLGPCIDKCCFEVGKEVYNAFCEKNRDYKNFFTKSHKYFLDLKELNIFQLRQIKVEKIEKDSDCTFCKETAYYSFRRQKKRNGSMFSFITKTG